jgi:hypothetical protein
LLDEITRAIGAHGLWKGRLAAGIGTGGQDLDPAIVGRDDACDFGRFLAGPAMPAAEKAGAHYQKVRAAHAAFHRCACTVVLDVRAGRVAKAQAALAPGGAFSAASVDVTQAMMAWQATLRRAA